jgi:hypothetical protein
MGKSYRIRTELGINKQIQVNLEQDYDFLEILSLKFRPEEIYPRACSDFGVITGRVIANGGYGIPNAKVSVFIPITSEDIQDPVISTLYPYTRINDVNEDGYRYNLLPYTQQHGGHTPTGTFPSINDVLVDNTVIEIYDKYYKFTVKTNESGDYMIFGVPLGNQIVFMDLDLSDMGPFSLSPQDLIRMGRATEAQVDGTLFKASENLDSLPQIVSQTVEISVEPFWGQEDLCQTKIHRLDFDLRRLGIEIEPTAVFIGSMISDADKYKLKRRCKPASEGGDLCNLVAGPGEILAIRQTIFVDSNDRPILEEHKLENGGRVIDEDGTWVTDIPMNLDFVTTNEFGETILSPNPSIGIPTSAKYRFKIKWQQSVELTEGTKRGYYLVPNIREYGWDSSGDDPVPSAQGPNQPASIPVEVLESYAFSLDWNDYGNTGTTFGNQIISDAINCVDKFYVFKYKKLYTVSQLIDQYHNGRGKQRFIGIKEITDTRCESENNKFPTTDGVRNTNLFYTISSIFLLIIYFLIFGLLIPIHLIAFISRLFCRIYNAIIIPACRLLRRLGLRRKPCPQPIECKDVLTLRLPMLAYPDCSLCEDCNAEIADSDSAVNNEVPGIEDDLTGLFLASTDATSINLNTPCLSQGDVINTDVALVLQAGRYVGQPDSVLTANAQDSFNSPWRHTSMYINRNSGIFGAGSYLGEDRYFACELPFAEKINLFNTKAKYFDGDFGGSIVNGGIGGTNQIKVYVEPTLNTSATTYHHDNTYILIVDPETLEDYTQGRIISFQDPLLSNDFNITGNSGNSIVGSGATGLSQITVTYANPQDTPLNPNPTPLTTTYNVNFTEGSPEYVYPTDIEYFQVITGMTYNNFMSKTNPSGVNDFASRYLNYIINIKRSVKLFTPLVLPLSFPPYNFSALLNPDDFFCDGTLQPFNNLNICNNTITDECSLSAITAFNNYQNFGIIILNRGVDANTERVNISFDLSRIFGYTTYSDNNIVSGSYKLNIPVQPYYRLANHVDLSNNANDGTYLTDRYIFYPSFNSDFNSSFSSFTTNLHTYYSSLDFSSVTSNFIVNNSFPWSQLNQNYITVGNQIELRTGGPLNPTLTGCGGYFETTFGGNNIGEYIEGGSYAYQRPEGYFVYNPNCVSTPSAPNENNCDNNEETFIYFAPKYDSGDTITVSASTRLVFRSDRLPTSTTLDQDLIWFGLNSTQNNSAPGQQNNNFFIYQYNDDSTGQEIGQPWLNEAINVDVESDVDGTNISTDTAGDYGADSNVDRLISSLGCESLVDLGCYQNSTVLSSTDDCNRTGPNIAVKNGCYILVKRAILDLNPIGEPNNDFAQLGEWVGRLRLNLGACLGAISHTFVNSWINGTLYHFSIKNNRFFDAENQPYSLYCSDVVVLDPNTNNYYYRSSPYNLQTNSFVGKNIDEGVQDKNLLFPTTIMDLGPLNSYTNELIYGPEYEGYIANKLKPTSYQDVSEILQLFFLSRLTNAGSLALGLGIGPNSGIASLFSNNRGESKKRIDGDYAQSIQINSQFGIFEFSPDQYDDSDIYFGNVNSRGLLGIFFDGSNQNRDLISPRRIIFNELGPSLIGQIIPIFTQEVPYYRWNISAGTPSVIFGTENNDWSTQDINSTFYQTQDRTSAGNFFRGGSNNTAFSFRGFITNVDSDGVNISGLTSNSGPNPSQVGGPWYFYFGLKNAATALDKFYLKYVE